MDWEDFKSTLDHGSPGNPRLGPVSFQRQSSNSKLSHVRRKQHRNGRYQTFPQAPYVCSTYVSISATCGPCVFKDNGCYVQSGQAAKAMERLDVEALGLGLSGTTVNKLEADLIDAQWSSRYHRSRSVPQDGARGGRDMRLHVGGDTATDDGAYALAKAVERYRSRGGGDVWTYTHSWQWIRPQSFGSISAYASVETPEQATSAIDLGWTPAWTVQHFDSHRAYREKQSGVKIVPCPAQTQGRKCVECRLCFRPLPKGTAVGFQLHGMGAAKASRKLPVLNQTEMRYDV